MEIIKYEIETRCTAIKWKQFCLSNNSPTKKKIVLKIIIIEI